ncbi:GDSL esterase/lipase [Trifolium repens]|nr:GDSL esterase/lipase [Trifolium repens]
MANEVVLHCVHINIYDCGLWKLFPKLHNSFIQFVVKVLGHLVERFGTTKFIRLGRTHRIAIQHVCETTQWTYVVYPK